MEYGDEDIGIGGGRLSSSRGPEPMGGTEAKLPDVLAVPPSKGLVPKLFARRIRVFGLLALRDCRGLDDVDSVIRAEINISFSVLCEFE